MTRPTTTCKGLDWLWDSITTPATSLHEVSRASDPLLHRISAISGGYRSISLQFSPKATFSTLLYKIIHACVGLGFGHGHCLCPVTWFLELALHLDRNRPQISATANMVNVLSRT